jgi:hypothetical protein
MCDAPPEQEDVRLHHRTSGLADSDPAAWLKVRGIKTAIVSNCDEKTRDPLAGP